MLICDGWSMYLVCHFHMGENVTFVFLGGLSGGEERQIARRILTGHLDPNRKSKKCLEDDMVTYI